MRLCLVKLVGSLVRATYSEVSFMFVSFADSLSPILFIFIIHLAFLCYRQACYIDETNRFSFSFLSLALAVSLSDFGASIISVVASLHCWLVWFGLDWFTVARYFMLSSQHG